MEKQESDKARMLAVAFFVLVGAVFAFAVGTRVGSSLDRHGRSVTIGASAPDQVKVAHDHVAAPLAPPVAQK